MPAMGPKEDIPPRATENLGPRFKYMTGFSFSLFNARFIRRGVVVLSRPQFQMSLTERSKLRRVE
jgi:hypothetical protein